MTDQKPKRQKAETKGPTLQEFKELILFAKEHRIINVKFGHFEATLSPMAFIRPVEFKETALTPEQLEMNRKREEEEILFHSA